MDTRASSGQRATRRAPAPSGGRRVRVAFLRESAPPLQSSDQQRPVPLSASMLSAAGANSTWASSIGREPRRKQQSTFLASKKSAQRSRRSPAHCRRALSQSVGITDGAVFLRHQRGGQVLPRRSRNGGSKAIFAEPDRKIRISSLGYLEVQSAFAMKVRSGVLAPKSAGLQRSRFMLDIAAGDIEVYSTTEDDFEIAERLIGRYSFSTCNGHGRAVRQLRAAVPWRLSVSGPRRGSGGRTQPTTKSPRPRRRRRPTNCSRRGPPGCSAPTRNPRHSRALLRVASPGGAIGNSGRTAFAASTRSLNGPR